jgi:hypothetical protein
MSMVGMATAYDLTVGVVVNMDEAIYMISPVDSPMISGLGSDGLSVLGSAPVDEIEFFWMHEEILLPRSVVGVVVTADVFITVATGDRPKFSTGDILKLIRPGAQAEIMRVTGYGTTADTLTVTRGYDGTTATTYAATTVVIALGQALPEGSNPENSRMRDRSTVSNYTQIFGPTKVTMSRTEQKVRKYGVPNELSKQLFNRTTENVIHREQTLLYGRKTNSATTKIRTMGGLDFYITTNVDATSTQLTVTTIQNNQQLCYNAGKCPDRLAANPTSLNDLNAISDTGRVRQTFEDPKRGRVSVMEVWTEFGPISIVRNRWVSPFHAFGFSRDQVTRRIFDPLQMVRLAKTGDSDELMIVCEESLEVKGQQHMFKMTNLTY